MCNKFLQRNVGDWVGMRVYEQQPNRDLSSGQVCVGNWKAYWCHPKEIPLFQIMQEVESRLGTWRIGARPGFRSYLGVELQNGNYMFQDVFETQTEVNCLDWAFQFGMPSNSLYCACGGLLILRSVRQRHDRGARLPFHVWSSIPNQPNACDASAGGDWVWFRVRLTVRQPPVFR